MNLADIFKFFDFPYTGKNQELVDLKLDSRQVNPGDLFLAVRGSKYDGREYVSQALQNGAAVVFVDADELKVTLPIIHIPNLKQRMPELAAFFYQWPSEFMQVIGVTGTNGKTSITHYIAQLFTSIQTNCGIMGTLGHGWPGHLTPSGLTTSDNCTVQRQLAHFLQNATKHVAMEVSSHALDQQRLDFVKFSTAVFTNLTQDHLDYHTDMEDYFAAKTRLFADFYPEHRVINLDDPYGLRLLQTYGGLSYSLRDPNADVYAIGNTIYTPWGIGILTNPLLGEFNLSNLLACISVCGLYGMNLDLLLAGIKNLQAVPGRMQKVLVEGGPLVVVDYAHTPDALANALQALQVYCPGDMYCVFGCGGDRDRSKRPLMLAAALANSDQVVITQDNPRTEDPEQIIAEILSLDATYDNVLVIQDRLKAIQETIMRATSQDVILIAGKGHEDYQIIGTQKLPFSDAQAAHAALVKRGSNAWVT